MDFIWPLAGNTSLFQELLPFPVQEAFHLRPIEKVQPLAATSCDQRFGAVKNIDIRASIPACWRQFVISLKRDFALALRTREEPGAVRAKLGIGALRGVLNGGTKEAPL